MNTIDDKVILDYPVHIETRVALLEMSISNINDTMKEIKSELKEIKSELKDFRKEVKEDFKDIRKDMKTDFYKLLGFILTLAGVMAKGFHWF